MLHHHQLEHEPACAQAFYEVAEDARHDSFSLDAASQDMLAEIDVFSGWQALTWSLNTPQLIELQARLACLHSTRGGPPRDALAYRGLRLRPSTAVQPHFGHVTLIEVGAGTVRLHDARALVTTLGDPGMLLEQWLVGTAQGHIDEALRLWILQGLSPNS